MDGDDESAEIDYSKVDQIDRELRSKIAAKIERSTPQEIDEVMRRALAESTIARTLPRCVHRHIASNE